MPPLNSDAVIVAASPRTNQEEAVRAGTVVGAPRRGSARAVSPTCQSKSGFEGPGPSSPRVPVPHRAHQARLRVGGICPPATKLAVSAVPTPIAWFGAQGRARTG